MPSFSAGDVVKVPFPYTDQPVRQWRPALVVAAGVLERDHALIWVCMITSAENRSWPGDVTIASAGSGLPTASVIRPAKIATLRAGDAIRLGVVSPGELAAVLERVHGQLG